MFLKVLASVVLGLLTTAAVDFVLIRIANKAIEGPTDGGAYFSAIPFSAAIGFVLLLVSLILPPIAAAVIYMVFFKGD